MAAAGAWASALGAAILGGNQGYQDRAKFLTDQQTAALQAAILRDQVNELPKRHAEDDIKNILAISGDAAYGNPQFQRAGQTVFGGPVPTNPDVQLRNAQRKANLEFITRQSPQLGARGAAKPPTGPNDIGPEPAIYNQDDLYAWQRAKALGLPEPPLQESAEHKLWFQKNELVNKASLKPPSAATERERNAYAKVRVLIPQLRSVLGTQVADPTDPEGQKAIQSFGGWATMLGQKLKASGKAMAYNSGFPLPTNDEKTQQLAGALRVMGAAPYMAGSRSMQMFNEAAQHLTNRNSTPEAMNQILNTLEDVYPEFEQAVGFKWNPQSGALEPAMPTVNAPGAGTAHDVPLPSDAQTPPPAAAPQAVAPPPPPVKAPAAIQPARNISPAGADRQNPNPKQNAQPLSKVVAFAAAKNRKVQDVINDIYAAGGTVVKDQ